MNDLCLALIQFLQKKLAHIILVSYFQPLAISIAPDVTPQNVVAHLRLCSNAKRNSIKKLNTCKKLKSRLKLLRMKGTPEGLGHLLQIGI